MREYTKQRREYNKKYWSRPKNRERRLVRNRKEYEKHPTEFAVRRHASEMRSIIRRLVGKNPIRNTDVGVLYDLTREAVLDNKKKAALKFPHGIPDARRSNVEFKVGFDRLHGSQFVRDILNGCKGKVRWAPSYDSIELALRGRKNTSLLFDTYRDFVVWKYNRRIV